MLRNRVDAVQSIDLQDQSKMEKAMVIAGIGLPSCR